MSRIKDDIFSVEYCYICCQHTIHQENECQNHCEHEMPEDYELKSQKFV